jgi:hypothetical protein
MLPVRAMTPFDSADAEARAARIAALLDTLHLNAEDLTELAQQAVHRVLQIVQQARAPAARSVGNADHP